MIRILKTTWVNKTRAAEMLGLRRKLYFPLEKHKILFIFNN
jgi:DNA-binding protein Fis